MVCNLFIFLDSAIFIEMGFDNMIKVIRLASFIIIINLILIICYLQFYFYPQLEKLSKIIANDFAEMRKDFIYLEKTTLRKPDYNAQGCFLVLPDGSAYIPVLFSDEANLKKYQSDIQWKNNLKNKKWNGYYDMKKIYIPIKSK